MPRDIRCFEVLIASPSDVQVERQIIVNCIEDWNAAHSHAAKAILLPRRWELDSYPDLGDRPQEKINKQIVDCADILFGAFWHRLGTSTGVASSGTVEEIDRFVGSERPVLLYFSQAAIPHNHDATQFQQLAKYKSKLWATGITFDYPDTHEFRRMVTRHLAAKMNALLSVKPVKSTSSRSSLVNVEITTPRKSYSGDVRTVTIEIVVHNLSETRAISEYQCIVTVPDSCLTFQSAHIFGAMPNNPPGKRRFRIPTDGSGPLQPIYPESKRGLFALDLGIDQLNMVGTYLAGDINAALADSVTAKVVIGEDIYEATRYIADIFSGYR